MEMENVCLCVYLHENNFNSHLTVNAAQTLSDMQTYMNNSANANNTTEMDLFYCTNESWVKSWKIQM